MTLPLRRTRPNTVNAKRRRRLYKEQFGGHDYPKVDYSEAIRAMPCTVCWPNVRSQKHRFLAYSVPHHTKTRGAGGKWFHLVPICISHHQEVHQIGFDRFDAKYGVDLKAVARELVKEIRG